MKFLLIAMLPIIILLGVPTVFLWINLGWKFGILIPSVIIVSIGITSWINYWTSKGYDANQKQSEVKK